MEQTPQTTIETTRERPVRRCPCGGCSRSPAFTRSTRSSGTSATRRSATATASPSSRKASEFPKSWSQNSTNIVAQKYFRGQLDSPTPRALGQADGGARRGDDLRLRHVERGYFASVEDGDAFEAQLTYILLNQLAAFNSPVWFNVGFEEQPAVLGLLHPLGRGRDGLDPRAGTRARAGSSAAARARASTSRRSAAGSSSCPRAAPRRAPCPSCAAPTPGPARSSPEARPAARRRWSCSTWTIRRSSAS